MPSTCPVKKTWSLCPPSHEHISHSHVVVPNIPNLISESHPHYKHFESIAHTEHRKINNLFLARLRQEQASDPWINEIKHALQYNNNTHPLTQKWVNANLIVEINGIIVQCAKNQTSSTMVQRVDTILVPASMRDDLMEMLKHHWRGIATYRIFSDHYYWPSMHTAIRQVVASCQTCNASRSWETYIPFKSQPLPTQYFK